MTEFLDALNKLAGSPFVALIIAMVVIVFLYRLYQRALDSEDRAWDVVRTLADAQKESNAITKGALDRLERSRA